MSKPHHILLVDDHALIQHALNAILAPVLNGGSLSCAAGAQTAIKHLKNTSSVDLILLDLQLADSDGMRLFSTLREIAPRTPIAFFSGQEAPIYRQLAHDMGAVGFLSKTLEPAALLQAVTWLLQGKRFFDVSPSLSTQNMEPLNERQLRILSCLLEGLSNKDIALRLDLCERTIKLHLTKIYHTLGVNSRAQAILVSKKLTLSLPETLL